MIRRIAQALELDSQEVGLPAVATMKKWETEAGREASPDEIRAVLAGPLLARSAPPKPAQRTVPGTGLPEEVEPESMDPPAATDPPAPKKRGRPKKNPDAPPAATRPAPGLAVKNAPLEKIKAAEKVVRSLERVAEAIATELAAVEPRYRREVTEIALVRVALDMAMRNITDRVEGDV